MFADATKALAATIVVFSYLAAMQTSNCCNNRANTQSCIGAASTFI